MYVIFKVDSNGLEVLGERTTTEPPNVSIDPTSNKPGLQEYQDLPPTFPSYPSKMRVYTGVNPVIKRTAAAIFPAKMRVSFTPWGRRASTTTPTSITPYHELIMDSTTFFARRRKHVRVLLNPYWFFKRKSFLIYFLTVLFDRPYILSNYLP